ncbi:MAG: hypothetical protein GXX85_14865 [Ignavibacteria bacterium]|nr:hypothetical protein [Ignavibacteria bacterium]
MLLGATKVKFTVIIIFILSFGTNLYCQESVPANALNIDPAGVFFGNLTMNYEHLFGKRHGLFIESGLGKKDFYLAGAGYRFHYFNDEDTAGINSGFFGVFVKSGRNYMQFEGENKKKYDVNLEYLSAGINIGYRYKWGEYFNYSWRIGCAFPLQSDFKWHPADKPEDYKDFQTICKILSYIDGEISIGYNF